MAEMIAIANRKEFEEIVCMNIGPIDYSDLRQTYYFTSFLPGQKYYGTYFSAIDTGETGITVTVTGLRSKKMVAYGIYSWADAFTLLYMLLNIDIYDISFVDEYGNENEMVVDVDAMMLLMRSTREMSFDFQWAPSDRFYDYPDTIAEIALDLVKCGVVKDIEMWKDYEDQRMIQISGELAICAPADLYFLKEEGEKEAFPSSDFFLYYGGYSKGKIERIDVRLEQTLFSSCGQKECRRDFCLLCLCGYFEYLYRMGKLYAFFLERKNFKIPTGNFNFSWKPKNGLQLISDATYHAACMLVELGQVSVDVDLDEKYRIKCKRAVNGDKKNGKLTLVDLVKHICTYDNPVNIDYAVDIEKEIVDYPDDYYCVFTCAAYIYYLKKTNQESLLKRDREIYHAQNRGRKKANEKQFGFQVSTDSYMDVSRDMWEAACEMQRQNYVALQPSLFVDENDNDIPGYVIVTCKDLCNAEDAQEVLRKIENGQIDRKISHSFSYTTYNIFDIEANYKAEGWPQLLGLAAFIDYLDMMGELVGFEEKLIAKWERERIESRKALEKIDAEIIDKVIENPHCDSLHCIIQGEDGTGRKKHAIAIAKKLLEARKIDHFEELDDMMSFEMASYKLQHHTIPHEGDLTAKAGREKDGRPITMEDVRSTLFLRDDPNTIRMYYNSGDYVTEKVSFKKRRAYILTNLRDFLPKCEDAKIGDNSRASHLIESLGQYSKETYIILVDEKKYIEHLFALFPQIKYLFGSTVISMASLSGQELFGVYKESLQEELRVRLEGNEGYEQRFIEFCARNKKNFAMKNRELAEFLANYSNIHSDADRMFEAMEIHSSKSTEELLESVIGMDNVRKKVEEFQKFATYRKYADSKGMKLPGSNMHMLFTGNPGTGKTMIARIIGQILYDVGIIEENKVIEVEGKDLKGRYIGESGPKTAAKIDEAIGGVLFIDEAYAIGNDSFGKEVIATLIKSMEDRKDQFVVIFAGYPKEMQEFININSGINSRIGYKFHFDDYTESELFKIFQRKMELAGFKYSDEEEVEKKVRRLCQAFCKKRDFGNGRFIDKLIQQTVISRATRKFDTDNLNVVGPEDIPDITKLLSANVIEHSPYKEQLASIVGMDSVKKKIEEFDRYVRFRKAVEDANPDAKIPDSNMHMIFTGNPGTGKTTIARIMVDLLYDVGVIKERKYLEVERKDLVGEYIGKTAVKTGEVIERALNGVLFIDEAYSLAVQDSGNDFGAEAISTLIKAMEDHKSDLVVIFAGYRDEMRRFEKINPGISSRIGYRFDFQDYSGDELVSMFRELVEKAGFHIDADALERVRRVMDDYRRKQNFGNGRFVSRLWQDTLTKHALNYDEKNDEKTIMIISARDIPSIADMNSAAVKKSNHADLDSLIGLREVKAQMKTFETWVRFCMDAREEGLKIPSVSLHMVFTGNPGTGKTTVARIIAQKLYDLGVIMENKVVEVDRSKLVSNHVGETAMKTHDVIESAMGGVLFIDEAYMLAEQGTAYNFGAEAVNTLMKVMEDKKEDFVVIFAGYKGEMKEFLEINPGIESRIGYTFHFQDYTGDELLQIFEAKMASYGFVLDEKAKKASLEVFQSCCDAPNFGNGRFVDKVIRQTLMNQSMNYEVNTMNLIGEEDIPTKEDIDKITGNSGNAGHGVVGFHKKMI